jgi:hypothetical protein
MDVPRLLRQSHLSVITRYADYELARIQDIIGNKALVDGRVELEEVFGKLLTCRDAIAPAREQEIVPKTLDLIGHATPGHSMLMIGDWVIDAARPAVTAFFRELADNEVLPRLGIHAVRLLGCQTADTCHGRATVCVLSDILGLEVHATTQLIYSAHYDKNGFRDDCTHALVRASDLRGVVADARDEPCRHRYPRVLDVDALPASPLIVRDHPWPRRIASTDAARIFLRFVRRTDGAQMPGLLAVPSCEVALPAVEPNWYHFVQVLLEGTFVRVYPEGQHKAGVVYPVDDPHALRTLVDELPSVPTVPRATTLDDVSLD